MYRYSVFFAQLFSNVFIAAIPSLCNYSETVYNVLPLYQLQVFRCLRTIAAVVIMLLKRYISNTLLLPFTIFRDLPIHTERYNCVLYKYTQFLTYLLCGSAA
jgi:hypothetical protein